MHMGCGGRGTLARSWSWNNTGKLTQWLPGFLERLGLQGKGAVELPLWQTGSAAKGLDDLETGEELLVIGGRNKEDVEGGLHMPCPAPLSLAREPPNNPPSRSHPLCCCLCLGSPLLCLTSVSHGIFPPLPPTPPLLHCLPSNNAACMTVVRCEILLCRIFVTCCTGPYSSHPTALFPHWRVCSSAAYSHLSSNHASYDACTHGM